MSIVHSSITCVFKEEDAQYSNPVSFSFFFSFWRWRDGQAHRIKKREVIGNRGFAGSLAGIRDAMYTHLIRISLFIVALWLPNKMDDDGHISIQSQTNPHPIHRVCIHIRRRRKTQHHRHFFY